LTNSINGMRIAGMALAIAMCVVGTQASAQMRVFMGPGGGNNDQPPGSAGLGTAGLGLGGFGSATENMREPDPNAGAGKGLSLGDKLGVTGGAGGGTGSTSQGSLSSAIDHPTGPMNSVTNSLMGSVGATSMTIPALKPAAKRKPSTKAAAASSNGGAAAAGKETPAKNP
jgi:hypothetical protein